MSKREINTEIVTQHSASAVKVVRDSFDKLIAFGDYKNLKKADLLAYWLEEYCEYLEKEGSFDYTTVPRYKRGSVISANFGFNVGSELGGLHYALVLDRNNNHRSPVVTVIPLSSGTQETTNKRDVFLGNELYEKLQNKYADEMEELQSNLETTESLLDVLSEEQFDGLSRLHIRNEEISVDDLRNRTRDRANILRARLQILQTREKKNIDKLKDGSIALIEQITTISKMRIYKPRTRNDILHGVVFSDGALDKVNSKIMELFMYDK